MDSKRVFDIVVSAILLLILAPVLLGLVIVVAATMGRPVLFRQTRVGRGDSLFVLTKFRTMRDGDEPDEERLTRFGSLMRSTSLDELPELWHVLVGDMSLVGPRPLLPHYLPLYSSRQRRRHEVRPGITGLAQVSGRNAVDWDERLELDVVYVDHRSWRNDLAILLETVPAILRHDEVAADGHVTMPEFLGSESESHTATG